MDDIVDTANTLCKAAMRQAGTAPKRWWPIAHPVLSGGACLLASPRRRYIVQLSSPIRSRCRPKCSNVRRFASCRATAGRDDDRFLVGDARHRLGEQLRARKLADARAGSRLGGQRDRVGHDDLVQLRFGDARDRAARQHRVRAIGDDLLRAVLLQRRSPPCTACSRCRRCRP